LRRAPHRLIDERILIGKPLYLLVVKAPLFGAPLLMHDAVPSPAIWVRSIRVCQQLLTLGIKNGNNVVTECGMVRFHIVPVTGRLQSCCFSVLWRRHAGEVQAFVIILIADEPPGVVFYTLNAPPGSVRKA
jgi:hypothetical protein